MRRARRRPRRGRSAAAIATVVALLAIGVGVRLTRHVDEDPPRRPVTRQLASAPLLSARDWIGIRLGGPASISRTGHPRAPWTSCAPTIDDWAGITERASEYVEFARGPRYWHTVLAFVDVGAAATANLDAQQSVARCRPGAGGPLVTQALPPPGTTYQRVDYRSGRTTIETGFVARGDVGTADVPQHYEIGLAVEGSVIVLIETDGDSDPVLPLLQLAMDRAVGRESP